MKTILFNTEKIETIKSDPEIANKSKYYGILSLVCSVLCIGISSISFYLAFYPMTLSIFWWRFFCIALAFTFWGFSLANTCVQFQINKKFVSFVSLSTSIICVMFVFFTALL